MSNTSENQGVLIVGAGPVGLTIAVQLQRFGVKHRLIDKRRQRQPLSKAFAVHSRTLEVFEDIGLLEAIFKKSVAVDKMSIFSNGKRLIHYSFDILDAPYQMVASIPQCDIEDILEAEYVRLGGKLERGVELKSFENYRDGVHVELEKNIISDNSHMSATNLMTESCLFRYMLASDGNKSAVREGLNIPFVGEDYTVPYIIADGVLDWDGDDTSGHVYVAGGGYIMFFPLPGGRTRIVVDEPTGTINSNNLTSEVVNQYMLKKGIKNALFSSPGWLTVTPFRRRIIDDYQFGNIFFAGDACHVHSPIGGQGMNTGIQDGYNLAWKIAHKLKFGASDTVLSSYNAERRPVAEMVLRKTDQQMKLLGVGNPLLRFLRDLIIPKIARTTKFQKMVVGQASGFLVDYSASELSCETSSNRTKVSDGSVKVGARMIDASIYDTITRHGSKRRVYDLLQGNHYSLLFFTDNISKELSLKLEQSKFTRSDFMKCFAVVSDFSSPILTSNKSGLFHEVLCDMDGEVRSNYHIQKNSVLLVRPDAYVALQCSISEIDQCISHLENLYCEFPLHDEDIDDQSVESRMTARSNQEKRAEYS